MYNSVIRKLKRDSTSAKEICQIWKYDNDVIYEGNNDGLYPIVTCTSYQPRPKGNGLKKKKYKTIRPVIEWTIIVLWK